MLITDERALAECREDTRIWQGMPGIEVTPGGRTFVAFCTNGTAEQLDNYVLLTCSDDGVSFRSIAVARDRGHRCFDPCLWIDPMGRLWFIWSYEPDHAVYAAICERPDDEKPVFGREFVIGGDVMLNKPTVLSTGEWLFPIAVWDNGVRVLAPKYDTRQEIRGSFVYKTCDNGRTFTRLGFADVPNRSFDEHMILERSDGILMMLVRTTYGIGVSYSHDRGNNWTRGEDSGLGGSCSRFHLRRLHSGRVLLINNNGSGGRSRLTAFLSEDEGRSWPYSLLLDGRDNVAGPDACQTADGVIHIVYDYDRGSFARSLSEAMKCARELLTAAITEEDIIRGELVTPGSWLRRTISRLGRYRGGDNPYPEVEGCSNRELAGRLITLPDKADIIEAAFETFPPDTSKLHLLDIRRFDSMVAAFEAGEGKDVHLLIEIISFLRNSAAEIRSDNPMVERVKEILREKLAEEISLQELAGMLGTSVYYLCHAFRRVTGTTVLDYRNSLRLHHAKTLLVSTDMRITDICTCCGYSTSSYFTKLFRKSEGITPSEYRKFNQIE